MAEIIDTATFDPNAYAPEATLWVYCAFDVMMPHEIMAELEAMVPEQRKKVYRFMFGLQGPTFSMLQNGIRVDENVRLALVLKYERHKEELEAYLNSLAMAWWGKHLNPRSSPQCKDFFYYDQDGFQLKPITERKKVTTNEKALRKLAAKDFYTQPFVNAILDIREVSKELAFFQNGVDKDSRVRCSFYVTGTETGRFSSSKNPFGHGRNAQNQSEEVRSIYLADEGYIFAYPDLSQAESYAVAYYSGDSEYIKAVESGSVHLGVARMLWPDHQWTGNDPEDKALAESIKFGKMSLYDLGKRGGHGSNYMGQPPEMAKQLGVEVDLMVDFQARYFYKFRGIKEWHYALQRWLQTTGQATTAFGRERTFFGRLNEDATLKELIAYLPQSTISDIVKLATWRTWHKYECRAEPLVNTLADMHDGCLFQVKLAHLSDIMSSMISQWTIPVKMPHGTMTIPCNFEVGYKWQKKEMVKWEGISSLSKLKQPDRSTSVLDLVL